MKIKHYQSDMPKYLCCGNCGYYFKLAVGRRGICLRADSKYCNTTVNKKFVCFKHSEYPVCGVTVAILLCILTGSILYLLKALI